ncbi:DUF1553 domain-containing protein [Planctomyces sp. SH-PL14]|uniref:DUF1553 domain-containing protein n=1 Tax=Planctomyces sp. SH-PL14 TaxID=1632864 RepID=UPI00078B707F|nr:DUF1553 domain-containing protein [Planctomyces sp. SH-PL14]AMV21427.1 Planctomycete cytochrome C [Planctomyces sp. SH-PL14]
MRFTLLSTLLVLISGLATGAPPDFARDVRPILEQNCFRCHGAEKQMSGYRLDRREIALAGGELGEAAIVAKKAVESPLIRYVSGEDESMLMPPKSSGLARLSPEQVQVLRDWIEAGAVWPDDLAGGPDPRFDHWAWKSVQRPSIPASNFANPVDALTTAKLAEKNLRLSEEADRRTLIRRLSYDLIGLPPTPAEIDAFVKDPDPRAYERLVDRLLASPQYGERWARHWLDVVRFAESHGFEMNQPRPNAWPYRDYVIAAFNTDKPYDQFVREQLAGDVYGVDEATGFIVGGPWDQVKSPDPVLTAQQRADELNDMVGTTGSTFLGLTVSCARCHDHKFDPITAAEYYALTACFAGVQHGERGMRPADWDERQKRAGELRQELAAVQARTRRYQPLARTTRSVLLDNTPEGSRAQDVEELEKPRGVAAHAPGAGKGQLGFAGGLAELPNVGGSYHWWTGVKDRPVFAYRPRLSGNFRVWISWGCGWHTHAHDVRYLLDQDGDPATTEDQREIARVDQRMFADGSGEPFVDKPSWSGFRDTGLHLLQPATRLLIVADGTGDPVTADAVLFEEVASTEIAERVTPHLRSQVDRGENVERFPPVMARFVRFRIQETTDAEPCLDELEVFTAEPGPRNVALASAGAKVTSSGDYSGNEFHKLEHVNDGRYGNERSWISNERGAGWVQIELPEPALIDRVVWSRDRSDKPKYADRTASRYEVAVSTDGESWTIVAGDQDRLSRNYPHRVPPIIASSEIREEERESVAALAARQKDLETQLRDAETLPMTYAGRFVAPGETFRLHRGDPMQRKEPVTPGGLKTFGGGWALPGNASDSDRRVALAKWITDPANPLTARVLVNRIWHYHFGTGIVDTPSDFGINGGRPTHPELLDWLASEFVASGWSIKALHRTILTSRTYRQGSEARADGMAIDASDRLLWRYPPRRLEAEPLRDAILSVAGTMNPKAGGPGFSLFEPNTNYVRVYTPRTDFGPDELRRMVYQAKPRVELDTLFGAFDCPDAGQIAPRRNLSTTPLQALGMLNSEFMQQQSQAFAERIQREAPDSVDRQVRLAFSLAFGREPEATEATGAAALVQQHGLPALCRAIYNTNEFLTVR